MQSIAPASWLKIYNEDSKSILLLIDIDLNLVRINLTDNYKLETLFNISDLLTLSGSNLRSYDKMITLAQLNCSTS